MLGKIFPALFGDGSHELSTSLKMGDATRIEGDLPSRLVERYSLAPYTTAQQVLDEAQMSGELKAQQYLHTKYSRHRLKQLQSLKTIYVNQLKYSQEAMKVEEELQREKAVHGEQVIRHAFGSQETHRRLNGYEQAFQEVSSSFNF